MKKTNLLTLAVLCVAFAFTSCSKSDDSAVECHECHIAFISDGVEVEVPILNDGEEDFCGTELEAAEAPGFTVTIPETIIGNDTVPAGTYGDGNMEIHCEEHHDH